MISILGTVLAGAPAATQADVAIAVAVALMASYHVTVRVGGIYALERIAHDSERDRHNIASALATFVRESHPATNAHWQGHVSELKTRAPDVQAALDVLCRAPLSAERAGSSRTDLLDLSRTDLHRSGADLTDADLTGAALDDVVGLDEAKTSPGTRGLPPPEAG